MSCTLQRGALIRRQGYCWHGQLRLEGAPTMPKPFTGRCQVSQHAFPGTLPQPVARGGLLHPEADRAPRLLRRRHEPGTFTGRCQVSQLAFPGTPPHPVARRGLLHPEAAGPPRLPRRPHEPADVVERHRELGIVRNPGSGFRYCVSHSCQGSSIVSARGGFESSAVREFRGKQQAASKCEKRSAVRPFEREWRKAVGGVVSVW
jgi:hypothetical protein